MNTRIALLGIVLLSGVVISPLSADPFPVESHLMQAKLVVVPPQTVDDFGDVAALRAAFAPTEAKYNRLLKELKELTASADPKAEFTVTGDRYTLRISPCSIERKVDVPRAKRKLGLTSFMEACSVSIKALSNYLAAPEVEKLLISSRTGSRSYSPTPISTDAS